jgi:DNA-binding PadR family transcriptional regulator
MNTNQISYAVARGNLEALLLHTLHSEPQTAIQLINSINEKIGVRFSPGSVYPKLWKLQKDGYVIQDETKFALTEQGIRRLRENVASLLIVWKYLRGEER